MAYTKTEEKKKINALEKNTACYSQVTFNDVPGIMATILERFQVFEDLLVKSIELSRLQSPSDPPITQKELCRHLGVTAQTLIRWKKRKKIPFLKVGNTIRYDLNDVLSALNKNS